MNANNFHKNRVIRISLFILSCIGLIFYFHISTTFDEKYTLLLVKNNFMKLINLDALDVHPPFYYLILKYFLTITTFWTKSLFIKVIFARVLSLAFAICGFIYIHKILLLFHFKLNWLYQWLIFISVPNILGSFNPYSTSPIVNIRMYSLSAMIIVIEFYYLLTLNNINWIKNINIITIFSTLALYTHYFSAIISCIMVMIFIFKAILIKNKRISISLIISLFVSFILYLPWIPFLYRQLSIPIDQTAHLTIFSALVRILLFIILYLLFVYPCIWSFYHLNKQFNNMLLDLNIIIVVTVIFMIIFSLLLRPMFSYRYMYSIFWIYEVISLDILFGYIINKKSFVHKLYSIFWISILFLNFMGSAYYQLIDVDLPSMPIHEAISRINNSNKRIIDLNNKYSRVQESPNLKYNNKNLKYNIDNTPINFEYAYYLSSHGKYVKVRGLNNYFDIRTRPSYKPLFKSVYSHILK